MAAGMVAAKPTAAVAAVVLLIKDLLVVML
jgi:hypothetical protein